MAMSAPGTRYGEVSFVCFAFSLMMSFVLLVLFYKFNSHNRFAGYCKLLNQEILDVPPASNDVCLLSWELCVERLRMSDCSPPTARGSRSSAKIGGFTKEKMGVLADLLGQISGKGAPVDRNKFLKGSKILIRAIFGHIETRSWGFPPIIVAMFFLIVSGFLAGGIWAFFKEDPSWSVAAFFRDLSTWPTSNSLCVFGVFVLVSQAFLWWRFSGKLHSLMEGSATVDSFFWRFVPVRAEFLNGQPVNGAKLVPKYVCLDTQLDEAIKRFDIRRSKKGNDW
jgi:hypothetical protein